MACIPYYVGQENNSLVTAHLSEEGILSAVIATPTETYHIEPSQHYIRQPHPFHMVVYAKSHVKQRLNSTYFDYAVPPVLHNGLSKHHAHTLGEGVGPGQRLKRQSINRGNIGGSSCSMVLIADASVIDMFRDMSGTSSQLVSHVTYHVMQCLIVLWHPGSAGVKSRQAHLSPHRLDCGCGWRQCD